MTTKSSRRNQRISFFSRSGHFEEKKICKAMMFETFHPLPLLYTEENIDFFRNDVLDCTERISYQYKDLNVFSFFFFSWLNKFSIFASAHALQLIWYYISFHAW
mmetsp:Transcript_2924/g.4014  ORF Transcript_2924/g.4014 Transcript_2924/m.4014 type:complete len:104 (+) Transcript_2924:1054-1365(+)